jgi:hypothetical protein
MKYRTLERITRNFDQVYSRQKETKEIHIDLGDDVTLSITEHQMGSPIKESYITIGIEDRGSYSMDLSTFIKTITS